MYGVFNLFCTRLGGRAEDDRGSADLRQEIDRQRKQRQHFTGNGLDLINDDDTAAQGVKPPDGRGFAGEQGI